MKFGIKILAIGAVAILAIAGMAIVLTNHNNDEMSALASEAPVVSVLSDAGEDAVLVTSTASGESVPISGVQVCICRMNASTDGNQTTMRVMECVKLQTGEDGRVAYQFQDGEKYLICAQHNNQYGFANQNMNETEANSCYQHAWDWQNMEGQIFQYETKTGNGAR